MHTSALRILVCGAHPDDADFGAGGAAALYAERGHRVRFVSLTNGDAGHDTMIGPPLAERRRQESAAAAAVLGVEYQVLDNHDGALLPTLAVRDQVIRILREFRPDVVMTHRPWDYHPDHRYTGVVVQDAVVPAVHVRTAVQDVPRLRALPLDVYLWDRFQKPHPFSPDIVVAIDAVVEKKVDALHCHASQMYEALPAIGGGQVPDDLAERRAWLRSHLEPRLRRAADLYRDRLLALYGPDRGARVRYAEAFEVCEYGAPLPDEEVGRLFPFLGD